jgi:hypothetical protein
MAQSVLSGVFHFRFEELNRMGRHYRRDRVLVDKLRMSIAAQQQAEIVEPGNDALELYAVHEENRKRNLGFTDVIEERVLEIVTLLSHGEANPLF